jgi:predicted enzyme related to lactoylglutathione lyase
MKTLGLQLVWITVSEIKTAIKFYTDVLGFKLQEFNEEYGWAELSGEEGARLGIAQFNPEFADFKPGINAVPAITVENIDAAIKDLQKNKVNRVHSRSYGRSQAANICR